MRIKLIEDVKTEYTKTPRGGYTAAHVNYEGAKYPFKLMSFSNPATYEVLKDAKTGDEFEVESVKEGQYFQWKSAKKVEAETKTADTRATTYTPAARSNYETPEERAARQRLIVRQSSLAQAIQYQGSLQNLDMDSVLAAAERFTAWVYEAPDLFDEPNDLTGA